jgi:hypothetical protein
MTTSKEGVTLIKNEQSEVIAIIIKDDKTHHNIFYATQIMGMEEIEQLLNNTK